MLSSLPGIGPKTANRIIVELKDKMIDFAPSQSVQLSDQSIVSDTLKALNLLGYKGIQIKREVELIVSENKDIKIEELIKETLKKVK
jgi:Holliday junction DNA helicase RuvA